MSGAAAPGPMNIIKLSQTELGQDELCNEAGSYWAMEFVF